MTPTPVLFQPRRGVTHLGAVLAGIGCVTLVIGLFVDTAAAWANFLMVSYYLLTLGLGGLLFIALMFVCGAGWGTAIRRLPEALAPLIPVACAGVLIVLVFYPWLYPWYGQSAGGPHDGAAFRHFWLGRPFFLFRSLVYVGLWTFFTQAMLRASRQQDVDGRSEHTDTYIRLSAAFVVVFGATCWLSSVDWIMSLEPHWASTVFGVYHFSGMFLAALAMVAVMAVYLKEQGPLRGILTNDHLHDLGKLVFSFSSFWMYIWFSQFMLIWYVNNPEETAYFVRRLDGGWRVLFFLNILLNWVIPFVALMPRATKIDPRSLVAVSVVVLVGRWLDLYLMVLPPVGRGPLPAIGIMEAGLAAGAVGVFLLVVPRALGQASLLPVQDPYLVESLPHAEAHASHPPVSVG